ncbi:putative amidoligase enzyme-domain-containing protein [Fusarium redolens]|uniref:Amidoligase enzyme-domain-containing protein n=1 Tax=Fusarium redolens TaxID=48865 RepID=A0A9P9KXC8_FUSRE|nr:putative amidoligase enzyme-domain-containing protein [Fusarium redolens]KAH7270286.1 putative amidoligase enzyme-domain-containing protein [Fusarium redolens]
MEPRVTNETGPKHDDKYTWPPRASFGFELEFLVAVDPRKVEADDSIPGLAPATGHTYGETAVLELLRDHGFCAETVQENCDTKKYSWLVTTDGSVSESGTAWENKTYAWDAVEIASPPMYACDEAYRLVSVVVRLLTNNLRVRVNTSCGFHVHVGNGPHQMDMHASRNYAALQWASDPVLSTLHCPARSFARYSKSIRRFTGTELSDNVTADMARREVTGQNFIPRYISRARKLGEDPVASRVTLIRRLRETWAGEDDGRLLDPDCESDDSDYECEDSRHFDRPRKAKGVRREVRYMPYIRDFINGDKAERLDDESNRTRRDLPPQLDFPASQSTASCRSSDGVPLLDEQRKKLKAVSKQADILSCVYDMDLDKGDDDASLKASKVAWRGVTELLACDVGVHQIAHLMCDNKTLEKFYSYNWKGQLQDEIPPLKTKETHGTVESRLAGGSLDAEWIVTWIKIQCRMLEWARDAEPSQLMRVIGNLSRDDVSRECTYDVLDFLRDLEDSGDSWGAPDNDWGDQWQELDVKCRSIEVGWLKY